MGLFTILGNFVDGLFSALVGVIGMLFATAIFAVGAVIELAVDILGWIKGGLDELLDEGSTEVNVVMGSAMADFIRINQAQGNYTEISLSDLETLNNSVINVANNQTEVQRTQMIKSDNGLSAETKQQFRNKDVLKIKISA